MLIDKSTDNTQSKYSGVVAAMLTPCKRQGVPDPAGMSRLSQILVEHGCHGLFVLSSTGELPLLDENERRELVTAVREGCDNKAIVYAGISGSGTKQAIRYASYAAEDGADVAVAMAPFFLKADQEGLLEYVTRIADGSPIPVCIYNHFRMSSVFELETIMRLALHPNIVALKDSSLNPDSGVTLSKSLRGTSVSFLQGREPFLLESFNAGAAGCITALSNIAPSWHRILYDAVQTGDMNKAADYQKKITLLSSIFKLDKSQKSFTYFTYALRKVAKYLGWLDHTHGIMPGFQPDKIFDDEIQRLAKASGLEQIEFVEK